MKLRPVVRDVMTRRPVSSVPEATVEVVARMMDEHHCGEIPICHEGRVVGIVTDRDIACRVVARGLPAAGTLVRQIMSVPAFTIVADEPLNDVVALMQREHVRRVPVVDEDGQLIGIVSQVDIASRVSQRTAGHLLSQTEPVRTM